MAPTGSLCPRCGMTNPWAATRCINPACHALMGRVTAPKTTPIATDVRTDLAAQKPGRESQTLTDAPKTAAETPTRRGSRARPGTKSGNRSWRRYAVWTISAVCILSGPAAWGSGYLQGLQTASAVLRTPTAPPLRRSRSVPPSSPSSTPSPRVTHTRSPRVVVPVRKTPTATPSSSASALPPGMAELTGTIKNGQLQTIVWASISANGPWYPVLLMVDTGAQTTMVSGAFFKACGDQPTGQTATFSGIGGNEKVAYWPHVWLAPTSSGAQPIFANQVEPGGVGRSMLGNDGITILLGQNVLTSGTLTQSGTTWTLIYPVE